jgi:hypothetical protein
MQEGVTVAYYVMVCEGAHPVMPLAHGPLDYRDNWMGGRLVTESPPQPLVYTLDPDYGGSPKAMYDAEAIPVVREDVITALRVAGVDNVQYFDALVRDPKSGKEYLDYKAFNVVGVVECANMAESELMGTSESEVGDVDFHALVIDESKALGLLLFRLAEAVSAIVVHEKVKEAIEAAGIPGFVFYGPGEWSG